MTDLAPIPSFPASRRETCSFVLSVRTAFAILGRPFAYDYLMGLSGAAFLFAAHSSLACVRAWIGPIEDLYAEFLGHSLGFQMVPAAWDPEEAGEATGAPAVLRQSLEEGFPSLALGGWPEAHGSGGTDAGREATARGETWGTVTFEGSHDAGIGGVPGRVGASSPVALRGVPRRVWLVRPGDERGSVDAIVLRSLDHAIDLLRGSALVEADAGKGPRWVTGAPAYERLGERLSMGTPCSSACPGGGWACLAAVFGALRDARQAAIGYLQNFVAEDREDLDATVLEITDLYRDAVKILGAYASPDVLEAMSRVEAGREDVGDAVDTLQRVDAEVAELLVVVREGLAPR